MDNTKVTSQSNDKYTDMLAHNKNEVDKINEYVEKGYTSNYQMRDGKFFDIENKLPLESQEIVIDDEYRYEGMSNPSDLSILYILHVPGKSKGTMLLPYGAGGDGELGWFMKEVSLNKHNKDKTTLNKI